MNGLLRALSKITMIAALSVCGPVFADYNPAGFPRNYPNASAGSGAEMLVAFQPGALTAIIGTTAVYGKFVKTSIVDNITGSALSYTCTSPPVVTMFECGTSVTCASPVTLGSVTISASGTAYAGTISNQTITAGDYVGWAISGGICTAINLAVTSQIHAF